MKDPFGVAKIINPNVSDLMDKKMKKKLKLAPGDLLGKSNKPIIQLVGGKGDQKYFWIGNDAEDEMLCFGTILLKDIINLLRVNKEI